MHYIATTAISLLMLVHGTLAPLPAYAQVDPDTFWGGDTGGDIRGELELGDRDPRLIVANLINLFLGFLGIIALIILLASGFRWMTAGANQDQAAQAKSAIISAVIGLIIILTAYSLTNFLITSLVDVTT